MAGLVSPDDYDYFVMKGYEDATMGRNRDDFMEEEANDRGFYADMGLDPDDEDAVASAHKEVQEAYYTGYDRGESIYDVAPEPGPDRGRPSPSESEPQSEEQRRKEERRRERENRELARNMGF